VSRWKAKRTKKARARNETAQPKAVP